MTFKQYKTMLFLIFCISFIGCSSSISFIPAPAPAFDTTIIKGDIFTVSKHFDDTSNTWYYLTRIKHKDASGELVRLNLALTDPNELMGEKASDFAKRMGAQLVFNASMSTVVSTPSGEDKRIPVGIQIINGEIVQERETDRYTLGIKDNNELVVYPGGTTAQEILDDGINTALTAFVPLIEDHQVVTEALDDVGNLSVKNPRQVIAQFDNLDIVFLTCGGRGYGGTGMTAQDMVRVLKKMGVKFAYNLDGGGSISTVVNGEFINWKIDGHGTEERPRANFLYVK